MKHSWRSSPAVLFAVVYAINVLNYTDRYVLPAVAGDLKRELALTDTQIGLLGTAFLLVYAIAALPAGGFADRSRRTAVIAVGVAVWSLATLLTGLTRSFSQLFGARAAVGVGEASYFPPSTSLLADAFPFEGRARLMSWWGTASLVGVFLGFGIGGLVGGAVGWRAAFYVTALPGLALALLIGALREPGRGTSERLSASEEHQAWHAVVRTLLSVRAFVASILAQAFSYFVLGGVSFWIPLYMGQQFKLDTAQAGILSGAVIVVGGGIGTVVGGYLADLIQSRGQPSARLLVPGFGYALSAPFILIAVTTAALPAFLAAMFGATALLQFSSGPLTALSQDVIIPARRARAVALSLLLTHLLGDAFAPFALGGLSDTLGSLQRAFLVTPASVLVAAAIAFVGCRWVAADRAAMLREAGSTSS